MGVHAIPVSVASEYYGEDTHYSITLTVSQAALQYTKIWDLLDIESKYAFYYLLKVHALEVSKNASIFTYSRPMWEKIKDAEVYELVLYSDFGPTSLGVWELHPYIPRWEKVYYVKNRVR